MFLSLFALQPIPILMQVEIRPHLRLGIRTPIAHLLLTPIPLKLAPKLHKHTPLQIVPERTIVLLVKRSIRHRIFDVPH